MTYAANRLYCDANSHIMETVDWISKHADPHILPKLPPLNLSKSATNSHEFINEEVAKQKLRAERGETASDVVHGVKGWRAYGAFDSAERKVALDDLGFKRQLVFSTFSAGQYLQHDDMDVRYGGVRAHNRGMAEFCGGDERLIAVGQLSLADPALRRELKEDCDVCGAFWCPHAGGDKSPATPTAHSVAASSTGVPFMLHVGPNTAPSCGVRAQRQAQPKDLTAPNTARTARADSFCCRSPAQSSPHWC